MVVGIVGALAAGYVQDRISVSFDWSFWSFGKIRDLEALGLHVWQIGPACVTFFADCGE